MVSSVVTKGLLGFTLKVSTVAQAHPMHNVPFWSILGISKVALLGETEELRAAGERTIDYQNHLYCRLPIIAI